MFTNTCEYHHISLMHTFSNTNTYIYVHMYMLFCRLSSKLWCHTSNCNEVIILKYKFHFINRLKTFQAIVLF